MRMPAVPLCLAFALGVVSPPVASGNVLLGLAVLASLGLATAFACGSRRFLRAGTGLVLAAFVILGSLANAIHHRAVDRSELRRYYESVGERVFSSPHRITGRLRLEAEPRVDTSILIVDVESIVVGGRERSLTGGVRASVRGERRSHVDALVAGDRVTFWAVVREPAFFRNPGSFDGVAYLNRQHIDLFASVKSGLLVTRLESSPTPAAWISRLRRRTLERLERALHSGDAFGVVAALVTGVRSGLSPRLERVYQRAGIFHVMAISGAHVAMWILCLHVFLRWMGCSTRTTLVVLVLLLPAYAAFCGARAPVVRAVVMAGTLIGARLASVNVPSAHGLCLAALLLLVWEPASVGDAGFQLTMAAIASIFLFYEGVAERLASIGFLARPLAVSIAAQVGVIPVAAWHFHRISPAAPVASLAAIPVAAAICVVGVVLVIVAGVPVLATVVGAATRVLVMTLTGIAEVAADLPAASIRVASPGWLGVALYALALVALKSASRRVRAVGVAIMCGLAGFMIAARSPTPGVLEMTMLDVGHGDAILLSLPEGGQVLVDGGGLARSTIDVGESVVLPFLLDRGVRSLDAIIVSHADFDHIGGLTTIVDELRVHAIWEGASPVDRPAHRELRARARARGVPVRALSASEQFVLGGARFEILAAGETVSDNANDRSVVLRVSYAERRVLLTGDAERALEAHLVRSGVDLRADVLKVAHHGSRSSTTESFLDAVRPRLAVISARRNPSRAIPSPVVLHRLRERGIEYARTDLNGAVTVRVHRDGRLELTTHRQQTQ